MSESDKARELYNSAPLVEGLASDRPIILGNEPYLVMGDFAYILGNDGSVWVAPVIESKTAVYGEGYRRSFAAYWRLSVPLWDDIDEKDFPYNRLLDLLNDLGNMRDIMRQHGVKVETDK